LIFNQPENHKHKYAHNKNGKPQTKITLSGGVLATKKFISVSIFLCKIFCTGSAILSLAFCLKPAKQMSSVMPRA
jgi:hypothetical protein